MISYKEIKSSLEQDLFLDNTSSIDCVVEIFSHCCYY